MEPKWGWKPEPKDDRDFKYKLIQKIPIEDIPQKIDLRKNLTPIEDQSQIASCVSNATIGAIEYLYNLKILRYTLPCFKPRDYSRLYNYYYARAEDGFQYQDEGCYIRSAMKALQKMGICQEKYWTYTTNNVFKEPDNTAQKRGKKRTIEDYYAIENYENLLCALADDRPIIFGAKIYEKFIYNKDGQIKMPEPNEKLAGHHAMLAIGYNLKNNIIIVRNSWGMGWGNKGYCNMPIEYFNKIGEPDSLVADCWVVRSHPNN